MKIILLILLAASNFSLVESGGPKQKPVITDTEESAKNMNIQKIKKLLNHNSLEFTEQGNSLSIQVNDRIVYLIYDLNADRMRLMSPVIEVKNLQSTQLLEAMEANFHTALDARYAISNDVVWSVFVHPLSDLSETLFISALQQTYTAAATFGTEYSSGELIFPKSE